MRKKKGLKGEATGTISVQNRAGNEDINSRGGGGGSCVWTQPSLAGDMSADLSPS